MIAIQLILVVAVLLIMFRFLRSRNTMRTKAGKKIILVLFSFGAILLILFPDTTNRIAHFVGVGRGADLLLYGLTIAFIFVLLNNYVKAKDEHARIIALARSVAILEAQIKQKK